jgi:hypothetical protein
MCHIPAPGFLLNPFTGKWENRGVYKRHKYPDQCFWEPDKRWKRYQEWEREEAARRKTDKKFVHPEMDEFKREMWLYRLAGFWYSNNGIPTYLTGQHWFYLSVYNLDTGLPKYRDIDRKFFYFWQYCCEDPQCFGMAEVAKRRNGKTYRSGCIALELATRTEQFNAGIQSKNDEDAKKVFRKAIVSPYRKFPSFFKPNSNMSATGKMSGSELRFNTSKAVIEDDELESMIDFQPSNIGAYDGQKLGFYLADEVGKTVNVNVNDRWNIVKYCLVDEEARIIGKTIHTTTVEEMDKGGGPFKEMWKASNHKEKGDKRRTPSGMYRFFTPADQTRYLNQFGVANEEAGRSEILAERADLEDNPRALSSAKRKDPLDEKEAFQADASLCVFNPLKLNNRLDELKYIKPLYRIGNLHWKDGIRNTEVYFSENPNGRFKLMYAPPEGRENQYRKIGDKYIPNNTELFVCGIDPYEHRILAEKGEYSMSMGAIVVMKKKDPVYDSLVDGGPALLYLARPDNPETFFEDCVMTCFWYGCRALIETNKRGCMDYFDDRGMAEYAYLIPGKPKRGIDAGASSKGGGTAGYIAEITAQFIEDNINTVYFEELIEDWLEFSPMETTKYDAAMAFGYAYWMMKMALSRPAAKQEPVPIKSVFRSWRKKVSRAY